MNYMTIFQSPNTNVNFKFESRIQLGRTFMLLKLCSELIKSDKCI